MGPTRRVGRYGLGRDTQSPETITLSNAEYAARPDVPGSPVLLTGRAVMTRILVVEDEPSIASAIQFALEDEGYEVLLARNGREALQIVAKEHPALVLSDLMMPIMDGMGMATAIHFILAMRPVPTRLIDSSRLRRCRHPHAPRREQRPGVGSDPPRAPGPMPVPRASAGPSPAHPRGAGPSRPGRWRHRGR